jgi:SAM-dependent methyltransferase
LPSLTAQPQPGLGTRCRASDTAVLYNVFVLDPTKRFSNRVENYLKYRPGYPPEIIPLLLSECGLRPQTVIADLGSGTGLLSEIFLRNGNQVFGIEPNAEMRAAGEKLLARYPNFISVNASAETTTLADHSIDLIAAGQAFHWFDRAKSKIEFKRILKPPGWVVLIWNGFRVETSPLVKGYQEIVLRYGTDYKEVQREVEGLDVASFFLPGNCKSAQFAFKQVFDFEGLKGRLLSTSYAPDASHPDFEQMISDLHAVFDANQRDGKVEFGYDTEVYYGQVTI